MSLIENLSIGITVIFFLILLSYYYLLFIKTRRPPLGKPFLSLTIIIPAHNEEVHIAETISSVISAGFNGKKEVIVVDDGSIDKTSDIVRGFKDVKLIRTTHLGKANAMNLALKQAKGELIAIVDADSTIDKKSLGEMSKDLSRKNWAAVTGIVKVKNRKSFICMWVHIEQLYNSLMRSLFAKLNANITTPGPLSMYRRGALLEIGGFSTAGFSEDQDVTIRLIRNGYHVGFTEAFAYTIMPSDRVGFFRQRTRFARGLVNLLKRHLRFNRTIIDLYTLPLFLFSYIQAVIMGTFTIYQIISGYNAYFISKGVLFSLDSMRFLFEWFSIVGFIRWTWQVLSGSIPFTIVAGIGIFSTFLSYPLFFYAIYRYDRRFDLWHLIPIFFMFPFWLLIMLIYIICLPEYFRKDQYNIWKKNET